MKLKIGERVLIQNGRPGTIVTVHSEASPPFPPGYAVLLDGTKLPGFYEESELCSVHNAPVI